MSDSITPQSEPCQHISGAMEEGTKFIRFCYSSNKLSPDDYVKVR